jgi:hypothetical protein
MTDARTAGPTETEARQQLDDAQALLKKQIGKARKQFSYNLKLAQDRLDDATREMEALQPRRVALAPFKDDPEGVFHYTNVELLNRVYASVKRMMEVQVACHKHNLAIVEADAMPERPDYRFPEKELDYMEARAFSDLYLATFHWFQHGDGVDLVLRASGQGSAVRGSSGAAEAGRQAEATAIAEASRTDRNLAVALGQLGSELKETQQLIEWATGALSRLGGLSDDEKRAALEVPQWAKLSGKVASLGTMPERVRHLPEVARHFRRAAAAALAYEQVAWVAEDEGPQKGDRLTITGRLGPKAP